MENNNRMPEKDSENNSEEVEFENSAVDPGFETSGKDAELTGEEDERSHNIDVNTSIKEMRENSEDDATNYKNDRENGLSNPKNI